MSVYYINPIYFQSRSLFIEIFDILKIKVFTCSFWASVENGLLWRYASQSSLLYIGFRYIIELPLQPYQNLAVYLSGARVSIFPTLVPQLISTLKEFYLLLIEYDEQQQYLG